MTLSTPMVSMANNDDTWYCQHFRSRAELEEFVGRLKAAADEAWGPP
jgi:hypothetical protein